ncbi:Kinesin light chain [Seminavis robusta]|uniref:Kinesin light chain n=1 Tax=Seminavis robusta TaxID=568900 RepID=A0A9N8DK04_9STRA|nr:Kinesin light chain [Seminavis robusta]|eukprot:Sro101_g051440.1 Kinesin light chain (726) ;mRNA; f:11865-14042
MTRENSELHPAAGATQQQQQLGSNEDANDTANKENECTRHLETLGVSVYYLERIFLEELKGASTNDTQSRPRSSKIYEIENLRGPPGIIRTKGATVICPLDGRMGAAYVHCLKGEDYVGVATHMLSYSWSYTIGDIVDTLSDYCLHNSLDPKRTYIWICCLCVNQHRVVENSTSTSQKSGMIIPSHVDFFPIFGERVQRIGHLLAMMAPWNAPVYITRIWCIFEIFTAHTNGCTIDIVMPPKEKGTLEEVVDDKGGEFALTTLYGTLSNTKVEEAKASVESDRLAILHQLESTVGYSVLNNQVNELLRGWMKEVLFHLVKTRENTNNLQYVEFCNSIGMIFRGNGEQDAAKKLHQDAVAISEANLGKNHPDTAQSYNYLGSVLVDMGDYEGALSNFKEALAMRVAILGNDHAHFGNTLNNIGGALKAKGDYDGALLKHKEALSIFESALGKKDLSVATTYLSIGSVQDAMCDFEGALSRFEEVLAIRLSVLGRDHPETAESYNKIGGVMYAKGDYEGALAKFKECLSIQEFVLGKNHYETASSYNNIGNVLYAKGDYRGALLMDKQALIIFQSTLGTSHPLVATSYNNVGLVMMKMGNYQGALEKFKQALEMRLPVLGKSNPATAESHNNIGSALLRLGDYEGALLKHKEALSLRESALGHEHHDTAQSYNDIGMVLFKKGDHKEALSRFKECLAIWEPVLGLEHPNTKACLKWIEIVKETVQHG